MIALVFFVLIVFDIAILPIAGQTVRDVDTDQVTTQSVIPWKSRIRGYREFVTKHSDLISYTLNLLLIGKTIQVYPMLVILIIVAEDGATLYAIEIHNIGCVAPFIPLKDHIEIRWFKE